MATLIAQVTILQTNLVEQRSLEGGINAYNPWLDAIVVSPEETFEELDATEAARLVAAGAARFQ
jgi:hypothetical protein